MEAMIANVREFIDQHPALMAAVVWPVVSALLLLVEHWLETAVKRPGLAPAVGVLRAAGFDPIGLVRAVRAALGRSRGAGPGAPGGGDAVTPTLKPTGRRAKTSRVVQLSTALWLAGLMALGGCSGAQPAETQARVVATVEAAINDVALPAVREEYLRQGRAELAEARERGETAAQIRARLDALDERWRPVVVASVGLRLANDAYLAAQALAESDGDTGRVLAALAGLQLAWCEFRAKLPASVTLPDLLPCRREVSR